MRAKITWLLLILMTTIGLPMLSSAQTSMNKQIWNLKNADIRAVIQTVSLATGKTFVIDPRVSGTVSLVSQQAIGPDALYQVFLSLLRVLNLNAVPSGSVIKIVPSQNDTDAIGHLSNAQHPTSDALIVRIVLLKQAVASQLVSSLSSLMGNDGSISLYSPANALVLAGHASTVQRIAAIALHMDTQHDNDVSIVRLRYATANQLVTVLEKLQSSRQSGSTPLQTHFIADSANNAILVVGNKQHRQQGTQLITDLDTKHAMMRTETVVIPLNYLTAKKTASLLNHLMSNGGSDDTPQTQSKNPSIVPSHTLQAVSIEAEPDNNALVVRGSHHDITDIKATVNRLDHQPQQVLVEAIIVKIDEALFDQLGIVWGSSPSDGSALTNWANNLGVNQFGMQISHGVGFLPGNKLSTLIRLLRNDGAAEILATPSIMVLNNQDAQIDDGKNIGVYDTQFAQGGTEPNASGGSTVNNFTTPYNQIARKDVTLSLKVTPHISPEHMIRLNILQKDDSVAADNIGGTTGNPNFNVSQIKTAVLVKSGDVLVLGGLIHHEQKKTKQKVPILGSLPLIGALFRYSSEETDKKHLMVFIRPVVLSKQHARSITERHVQSIKKQLNHHSELAQLLEESTSRLDEIALPSPQTTHPA